jgi:hypothetical protein
MTKNEVPLHVSTRDVCSGGLLPPTHLVCCARTKESRYKNVINAKTRKISPPTSNVDSYGLVCPSPKAIHLYVVISRNPTGPRAIVFCVESMISAPSPNCAPSVNCVLALT